MKDFLRLFLPLAGLLLWGAFCGFLIGYGVGVSR